MVAHALQSATKSGDVGGQLRYLGAIGAGLLLAGDPRAALGYVDKALEVARQHPDVGFPYGRKAGDFFRTLLSRGYATARPTGTSNGRLFHVHHKGLYRAIGEMENRHRRPTTLARAVERLMVLDAVLGDRGRVWLATERDKFAHFTLALQRPPHELPRLVFRGSDSETIRYFPDKLPIAIPADGREYVFMYLVTRNIPVDFRAFLERHSELLRSLDVWRVRLLFPPHLQPATAVYRAAFHEQLATPLRPIVLEDLRWYFAARRRRAHGEDIRFSDAAQAFSAPRFGVLYRSWLEHGDSVLDATLSPILADALRRGTGQLECHVLPHRYHHLLPLVGTA